MLNIGTRSIAALRLGEREIKKAFLGERLAFDSAPPVPTYTITAAIDPSGSGTVTGVGQYAEGQTVTLKALPADDYKFTKWTELVEAPRLPEGYTELEYIQMGGTGFGIDTLFKPNANTTRLVMDFQCTKAPAQDELFVAEYGTNISGLGTRYFNLFAVNASSLGYRDNSNNYGTLVPPSITARMLFDYDCPSGTVSLGSVSKALNKGDYTLSYNVFFGSPSSADKIASYRLYSAQIYTNGTKERDFIPCKNQSGVIGLYDLVDQAFHGNSFTGILLAGPEVEAGKIQVESTVSESAEYTFTADRDRDLTAAFASTRAFNPTWTQVTLPKALTWADMCFGGGMFAAVGSGYQQGDIIYSADGVTWTNAGLAILNTSFYKIRYGLGRFSAVDANTTRYSANGINWSTNTSSANVPKNTYASGPDGFISVSDSGSEKNPYYYGNGSGFSGYGYLPTMQTYYDMAYGDGKYVILGYNSNIGYYYIWSANTWSEIALPTAGNWYRITYGGGRFVAITWGSDKAVYSEDGVVWHEAVLPFSGNWNALAYGDGVFVALAAKSDKVAYSTDGATWNLAENALPGAWNNDALAYGNGRFVVVSYGVAAYTS